MENKKVKKFIKQISIYKELIKPGYKKYYDDITALYIEGKLKRIDQATSSSSFPIVCFGRIETLLQKLFRF